MPQGGPIQSIYPILGGMIRGARKQFGITQEKLGKAIGHSRNSVSQIESGKQRIEMHTFFDVLWFFAALAEGSDD